MSDETPYPVSEFGDYRISHDTMTLEAVFYPPFKGAVDLLMRNTKRFKKYRSNKWDFRRSDKTFSS